MSANKAINEEVITLEENDDDVIELFRRSNNRCSSADAPQVITIDDDIETIVDKSNSAKGKCSGSFLDSRSGSQNQKFAFSELLGSSEAIDVLAADWPTIDWRKIYSTQMPTMRDNCSGSAGRSSCATTSTSGSRTPNSLDSAENCPPSSLSKSTRIRRIIRERRNAATRAATVTATKYLERRSLVGGDIVQSLNLPMVERRQKKFVEAVPLQVTFTTDVMEDGSTAVLAEGSGYITTCDAFTPLLRHSVAELCRRRRPHPKCILAPGVSLDERHRRPNAEDVETIALIKAADINSLFSSVFCKDDLELPEEDVANDKYGASWMFYDDRFRSHLITKRSSGNICTAEMTRTTATVACQESEKSAPKRPRNWRIKSLFGGWWRRALPYYCSRPQHGNLADNAELSPRTSAQCRREGRAWRRWRPTAVDPVIGAYYADALDIDVSWHNQPPAAPTSQS